MPESSDQQGETNAYKAYLGAKIILAKPATKDDLVGYEVVYPDGYVSWSPKGVFEEAYREVNHGEDHIVRYKWIPQPDRKKESIA